MASPTKLTPAKADALVQGVMMGLFDAQNALKNGIDVTTLKSWVDRGLDEEAEEPFKTFAERYVTAMIELEESVIGKVLDAADAYQRLIDSTEEFYRSGGPAGAGDDCDSRDFDVADAADIDATPFGMRKVKRTKSTHAGDWRAAAWYAERRWPLRWGNRSPEGGPREAIKLPEAPQVRRKKVEQMIAAPPPELIKAFRAAGYEIVKRTP